MTGWKCKGNSNLTLCFRAQHTLAIFLWNPTSECGCGIIHNFWVGCAEFETYTLMRDHVKGVHTTGVGTTPKRPRGNPTQHPSMGYVAHQLSIRIPSGGHTTLSNPLSKQSPLWSGYVVQTQR